MKTVALKVDVETDWGGRLDPRAENCQGILKGLTEILSLFEKHNIKATFFVSGNIAEQFKDIVIEIINQGNEVASYSYDHIDYSELDTNEIECQLKRSKDVLENILKKKVLGFRLP